MAGKEFLHEEGVEVKPSPVDKVKVLAGLCESYAKLHKVFRDIPMPMTPQSRELLYKVDRAMWRTKRKVMKLTQDDTWLMSYLMDYTVDYWSR